ncbi:hypothetical protein [Pseudoalteromonas sp. 1CM17D]|uniref:hypothetical protein n=1 Tax=Pseudoalteromonas sp. 1CM17D TaxID=2929162 RepID=UPI0020BF2210|nr:hypothetical protein [Pseudoalteromonas sp. 1CM17D]MCK8095040.1 hypothetical protein [Pseudoalteromonas sp. 1CM17D]
MSKNKIKLGKFGMGILPKIPKNKLIPLISKNKKKLTVYKPISTDGKMIFSSGEYHEQNTFFDKHDKVIVLTNKERSFLVDNICYQNIHVRVFENDYPIFDDIKYSGNLSKTYYILQSKIQYVLNSGMYPKPIFQFYSDIHRRAIIRKIPKKSSLDSLAYFCDLKSYQEVFRIKEERHTRKIYALDFNSMYPACTQGVFPNPQNLIFKQERKKLTESIPIGFYHVLLTKPKSNFIKKYHCFKLFEFTKNLSFQLNDHHQLEVFLTSEELNFYRNHFDDIYIYSSITSRDTLEHPRSHYGTKKYEQRYHSHLSDTDKHIIKSNLVTIHSSTNPIKAKKKTFLSVASLAQYLWQEFRISIEGGLNINELKIYLDSFSGFTILTNNEKITLYYPDLNSNSSIISISAFIVAKARIKLLQVMEHITQFKGAEICYVNTDSVHASIDEAYSNDFELHMKPFMGSGIGQLKVECIAKKGFWFDVGRYWLCDENKVIKYKNIIFSTGKNDNFFSEKRKITKLERSHFISNYSVSSLFIGKSFSYTKRLNYEHNTFDRYQYKEIKSMLSTGTTLQEEKLSSKRIKLNLFHQLKKRYSVVQLLLMLFS